MTRNFVRILKEVKECTFCKDSLRLPPKPVVQLHKDARLLIIAQSPGVRARTSGFPFDDKSGDRLREWLAIDRALFYDETRIALMPMGFCYPGSSQGGDLPPCTECAPIWHPQILPHLSKIELTLLVGVYAHHYYLQETSVTKTVRNFRKYLPLFLPLPHPSWHNTLWLKKNPWFEHELLPLLRELTQKILFF